MGQCISIWTESDFTDDGKKCPYVTHSDLKTLGHWLVGGHLRKYKDFPDVMGMIGERFNIDLGPFEKVFDPNHDEFEVWEASAQPPGELAGCLKKLVQALTNHPETFSEMEGEVASQLDDRFRQKGIYLYHKYFSTGDFLRDLTDLLRIAEWAEEGGEEWLRLYYG